MRMVPGRIRLRLSWRLTRRKTVVSSNMISRVTLSLYKASVRSKARRLAQKLAKYPTREGH